MRLIKQFNIVSRNLEKLKVDATSSVQIHNVPLLRSSVEELVLVPSLSDSAKKLLNMLPYSNGTEAVSVGDVLLKQIMASCNKLNMQSALLLECLKPLTDEEALETIYLKVPDLSSLDDLSLFISDIVKNLNQVFLDKFSKRYLFNFKGVEKGSDWLVLSLFLETSKSVNIDDIKSFLAFINLACEHYKNLESLSEAVKLFGDHFKNASNTKKDFSFKEHKRFTDSLLERVPLIEGAELTDEEVHRVGHAGYQLGKVETEKTEIEISGLLEMRDDKEVLEKVENIKILREKKTEYLPHFSKDD